MPGRFFYPQSNGRCDFGSSTDRLQGIYADRLDGLNLNGGQLAGFRNRWIAGSGVVTQRGAMALANATPTYGGVDRIVSTVAATTLAGAVVTRANTGAPAMTGFVHQIGNMTSTGTTSISCRTRRPSRDVYDMASNTVTVSGLLWHDFGSTVNWNTELYKPNAIDNFGAVTLIANGPTVSVPTSTWTAVAGTFTLGAGDAQNGLMPGFLMPSSPALTSKNVLFANLQFEIAPAATSLEIVDYAVEVSRSRAYYRSTAAIAAPFGAAVGTHGGVGYFAGGALMCPLSFGQSMVKVPNLQLWNNGVQNQVRNSNTGAVIACGAPTFLGVTENGFSAIAFGAAVLAAGGIYDFDIVADAEY